MTYNDVSVLENHHLAAAFKLISQEATNIFSSLSDTQYRQVNSYLLSRQESTR